MFSLKDAVRRTVIAVSLAAVTTSFFSGCSKDTTVNSNDLYPPSTTAEVETTDTFTDDINPGNKDTNHDSNTFSIKYKYWYDNPDVQKTQEESLAQNDPRGDNPNGEAFLGIPGLPLYTDPSGNQYIISGRTIVYLKDGKIAPKDLNNLRTSADGNKLYSRFTFPAGAVESIAEVTAKIASVGTQAKTYEARVADTSNSIDTDNKQYAVYMNNTDTGNTFSSDEKLPITDLISAYSLGRLKINGNTAKLVLTTGAGDVTLTFAFSDSDCTISYSTGLKDQIVPKADIGLGDDRISMTLTAIEDYLGYDVEVYDDFINIVTDNKDIITEDSILPDEIFSSVDKTLENNDTTKPADDPENVAARDEFIKENTEPEQETSKPEAKTTPDGKYTIAPTDLQNEDGTYTQKLGTGDPSDVSVPSVCTGMNHDWTPSEAVSDGRHGTSNPSQIPYSDITLENAAEAFPYLGYIGYSPDYLEIFPTDSKDEIIKKIWNNLVGTKCSTYYHYSTTHPDDAYREEYPTHFFSSEEEYNKFHNNLMEERRKADEAAARAQEDIDSGRYGFDTTDVTQDDINSTLDLIKQLGL